MAARSSRKSRSGRAESSPLVEALFGAMLTRVEARLWARLCSFTLELPAVERARGDALLEVLRRDALASIAPTLATQARGGHPLPPDLADGLALLALRMVGIGATRDLSDYLNRSRRGGRPKKWDPESIAQCYREILEAINDLWDDLQVGISREHLRSGRRTEDLLGSENLLKQFAQMLNIRTAMARKRLSERRWQEYMTHLLSMTKHQAALFWTRNSFDPRPSIRTVRRYAPPAPRIVPSVAKTSS